MDGGAPLMLSYALDDPFARKTLFRTKFRGEGALVAAVVLHRSFRDLHVMSRYPPMLVDRIRALGAKSICAFMDGSPKPQVSTEDTPSNFSDQLPDTKTCPQRVLNRS